VKIRIVTAWKEHRGFMLFLALMLVFRSAIADWNEVPTGSMKPTILEGDRIWVDKLAYNLRLPFSHISLYKFADPNRGDIIVFDSKVSDKRLVKRVIGLPGDNVAMKNNVLYLNGKKLEYYGRVSEGEISDVNEKILGVEYTVRLNKKSSSISSFPAVNVPRGHYLALGDNRDSSADSRMIGFVPRDEIVGRTTAVILSFDYDNFYIPRSERFFHRL